MGISFKAKVHLTIAAILALSLLSCTCGNQATLPTPSDEPSASSTLVQPSNIPDRVDVVYFHRPQRCPTCLCFEERVIYVVNTYFQNELKSGKLTFGVYNIGDSKNAEVVKKYSAVGSQLFINTVKDGTDHIRDIQEIWYWKCRTNKAGFDQQVKSAIEQSLKDVE